MDPRLIQLDPWPQRNEYIRVLFRSLVRSSFIEYTCSDFLIRLSFWWLTWIPVSISTGSLHFSASPLLSNIVIQSSRTFRANHVL